MRKVIGYQNDRQLLFEAQRGDHAAFAALFDKYAPDLLQLARKRLPATEEAQDIVQDIFIAFFRNLPAIEVQDSLGGYFYVALRNRIFSYYAQNHARLTTLLDTRVESIESPDSIYDGIRTKEIQAVIAAAVRDMPPKMRQIFQMSRDQHLSIAEITQSLHLSTQTVKNQLTRALHLIRTQLKAHHLLLIVLVKDLS